MLVMSDVQPAADSPPARGTWSVPSEPGSDLPCHAGQDPSAVSANPYTGSVRDSRVHDSEHPGGAAWHLLIRGRADDISARHNQLPGDRREDHAYVQAAEYRVRLAGTRTGRGH